MAGSEPAAAAAELMTKMSSLQAPQSAEEQRTDRDDGRVYTLKELSAKYDGIYDDSQLLEYWKVQPPSTAAEVSAKAQEQLQPLLKLLEKPPSEVAAWAVDQMKDLSEGKTKVESLPIFQVACALKATPAEQKETLIRSVMQGVADLPVETRTEAVRLFTQLPAPGLQDLDMAASSSMNPEIKHKASVLGASLTRLAEESGLAEWTPEEMKALGQVVEKEQGALMQPLLDIVPELGENERKQIAEALVKKGVVSEEKGAIIKEAMRPGGHADQFASLMKSLGVFYKYTWLVWVMPLVEIPAALTFAFALGCVVPLVTWLSIDAVIAMLLVICAYGVKSALASTYTRFSEDALGMGNEVQAKIAEGVKIIDAVPGANAAMYYVVGAVLLIVVGALLVILAVVEMLETLESTCGAGPRYGAIIVSVPIMAARVWYPVGLAIVGYQTYKKVSELKNQIAAQSPAAPLLSEPEENYGSV